MDFEKARKKRIALAVMVIALLLPRSQTQPDARSILSAAHHSGMIPQAFYLYAERIIPGDGESLFRAAEQCLVGVPNAQVDRTMNADAACVAVAITCAPNAWAVAETMHRIGNVLGSQASITLCLTGQTNAQNPEQMAQMLLLAFSDPPREGIASASYASFTGEIAQAAVRANGDTYLGIPIVPLDY